MAVTEAFINYINGSGSSQSSPARVDPAGYSVPISTPDSTIAHYRAGFTALAPIAAQTVLAILHIPAAPTKTIRLKSIVVGGAATAAGSVPVVVEWCSNFTTTGGTTTGCAAVPLDPNNAAATAEFVSIGTANITTVPAVVGILAAGRMQLTALATAAQGPTGTKFTFVDTSSQAPVLRTSTSCITISTKGATSLSGGVYDCFVEWSESPLNEG